MEEDQEEKRKGGKETSKVSEVGCRLNKIEEERGRERDY